MMKRSVLGSKNRRGAVPHRKKRISLSKLLFFATGLAVAISNAKADDRPETTKIIVGVTGVSNYVGVWVAADHHIFEKHGLSAEIITAKEGSTAVAGLMSGSFQFAGPTPTVFLQAVDNGLDLVIAAPTHIYPTPNMTGILAGPSSGIHSAKDLIGKKYGVPGVGGLQDVLSRQWLIENHLDPLKVNYIELSFVQMSDALRSGQVDAVTAGEPFYQRMVEQGVGVPVKDLRTIIPDGTLAAMYAATRDWVTANPKTLAAFRASLADAIALIKADPEEGRKSIGHWMKLPPETLAQLSIPNVSLTTNPRQMDFWIDLMQRQNQISHPVAAEKIIWP